MGKLLQRFPENNEAYGIRQFTYSKGTSLNDATLLSVLSRLLMIERGYFVSVFYLVVAVRSTEFAQRA